MKFIYLKAPAVIKKANAKSVTANKERINC